jgi:hypothetical protein
MRSKEFLSEDSGRTVTINIPITITIPSGNGDPSVSTAPPADGGALPPEPVNVFPLQQELELKKQQGGKRSRVINQIVSDDGAFSETDRVKESNEFTISEDFDHLKAEFERQNLSN